MGEDKDFMTSFQLSDRARVRMGDWWKKWDEPSCPICKTKNWSLPNHVMCMKLSVEDLVVITNAPISPFFPVHCMTCGYAMFVNALISGVVADKGGE